LAPEPSQATFALAALIVKTLFLAKEIHRIGAQNIRDKKTLHENVR